ncbi:MAG: hypothetical protein J07HQW2_02722 [Haloquadratum walsbyi J07HQW2]|uniref:Uncharacterized protein n=1 Tax=Haloquadratum walsbyi J07HQW2 TaxID=1238425 RepID=U1PR49_9EURY|nr:MAG: hypothetical protein J07HQW2_02722 [Haloquadratum walsbyi J07HQW2]
MTIEGSDGGDTVLNVKKVDASGISSEVLHQ